MNIKNIKLNKSQKKVVESHHRVRVSRRDLMGLGLHAFAGSLLAPTLIGRWAQAQTAMSFPGFMVFDLVGGAALPGNFLVGGVGGSNDLLNSYSTIGFNPRNSTMDERFGLPAPRQTSRMFEGMISAMSEGAQERFRMTSIAHLSVDDSSNNNTSALGLVAKFWTNKGVFKQKGLASQGTSSGGRTQLSLDEPALRPEALTDVTQLNLLTALGFMKNVGVTDENIMGLVEAQQNQFVRQFRELASSDQKNLKDQYEQHFDTFQSSLSNLQLDPRQIEDVRNVYGINQNTAGNNSTALMAGLAHTCISGFSGPSCTAIGGYDYHDGTQTTGDQADFVAGQAIGRAIEVAHRIQKPFFFQVLSDGSCSSSDGGREWRADSGERTLTLIGSYKPDGVKQTKTQIGHYTSGQIAESNTHVGRRTSNVAQIVFLNYLSNIGMESEIEKYFSTSELPTNVIDESITFTS